MAFLYRTETIKGVESLDNREIVARSVVLAVICAVAAESLEIPAATVWLWYAVYVAFQLLYLWVVSRLPETLGVVGVVLFTLLAGVSAATFVVAPAWLWTQPHHLLHLIGFMLLTGAMLNTLAKREADPLLRAVDTAAIFMLLAYIPLHFLFFDKLHAGLRLLLIAAPLLALYFLNCLWNMEKARRDLRGAAEREAEMAHAAAMGRVAGGVAHDFNNMLTVILGNLELRREIADSEEREALIGEAEAAARRAVTEIGYLTSYSRQAHLSPQLVSPCALLSSLEGTAHRFAAPDTSISVVCPEDLPFLRADAARLETVLTGLILNACEAMPRGGILRLSGRAASPRRRSVRRADGSLAPGDYVRIDIEDTGEGMADKLRERVTEPFFTTRSRGIHSGLGLSVAQGFAEQSGGALAIESRPGRGTTVSLYLPVAE